MEQADIKLKTFCEENKLLRKEVNAMIKTLGVKPVKTGAALYITEEDARRLLVEMELPEELQIVFAKARHVHDARNPNWVFAKIDGFDGKHPVLVPRRFHHRLQGKAFVVEVVKDKEGVTFRHEWFHKVRNSR